MSQTIVQMAYRKGIAEDLRKQYRGAGMRITEQDLSRNPDADYYDPESEGIDLLIKLNGIPPIANPAPGITLIFYCAVLFTSARIIVKLFVRSDPSPTPGPTNFSTAVPYDRHEDLQRVLNRDYALRIS